MEYAKQHPNDDKNSVPEFITEKQSGFVLSFFWCTKPIVLSKQKKNAKKQKKDGKVKIIGEIKRQRVINHPICKHMSQIKTDRIDYRDAKGPMYGRYRSELFYAGFVKFCLYVLFVFCFCFFCF